MGGRPGKVPPGPAAASIANKVYPESEDGRIEGTEVADSQPGERQTWKPCWILRLARVG